MIREIVVVLRTIEGNHIGPQWRVKSIREGGLLNWFKGLFKRRANIEDQSTNMEASSIGIPVTWDQYNMLANRINKVWDSDKRHLAFVPPPPKPNRLVTEI